jgi:hypothetical protein
LEIIMRRPVNYRGAALFCADEEVQNAKCKVQNVK